MWRNFANFNNFEANFCEFLRIFSTSHLKARYLFRSGNELKTPCTQPASRYMPWSLLKQIITIWKSICCDSMSSLKYLSFGVHPSWLGKTKLAMFHMYVFEWKHDIYRVSVTSFARPGQRDRLLPRCLIDLASQSWTYHYVLIPFSFAWFSFHEWHVFDDDCLQLGTGFWI